jgi:ABC-type bacteriocin/lantibiotic exporter with double-glycine peptidase domain
MPAVSLNVPHFKQELHYSCVAACVRMVLAHYGRTFTEAELRQHLGTGPHGTRARDILRVAALGFAVQVDTASLVQLGATLVAGVPPLVFLETRFLDYWQTPCDHVAVVVGLDLATVYLNDPFFDRAPQQTALTGFLQAWASNDHLAAFIRPAPVATSPSKPVSPEPPS